MQAIHRVATNGTLVRIAGVALSPGAGNLTGFPGSMRGPTGILVSGNSIFIADTGNHAIRRWDATSGNLSNFAANPWGGELHVVLCGPCLH